MCDNGGDRDLDVDGCRRPGGDIDVEGKRVQFVAYRATDSIVDELLDDQQGVFDLDQLLGQAQRGRTAVGEQDPQALPQALDRGVPALGAAPVEPVEQPPG